MGFSELRVMVLSVVGFVCESVGFGSSRESESLILMGQWALLSPERYTLNILTFPFKADHEEQLKSWAAAPHQEPEV